MEPICDPQVAATLLLDTHALLWWLDGEERLSLPARAAIADMSRTILVSAASAWEMLRRLLED